MFGFGRKAYLAPESEARIVEAIAAAENRSRAEIAVHLAKKVKCDVYADAIQAFRKTGLYKTELRNAVLIYVVPSEKQFAIVGDIGIHEKVHAGFWDEVRDAMTGSFRNGELEQGILKGIELAGAKLTEYFPVGNNHNPNELSNEISRS